MMIACANREEPGNQRIKTLIHFGLSWGLAITLMTWLSSTLPFVDSTSEGLTPLTRTPKELISSILANLSPPALHPHERPPG